MPKQSVAAALVFLGGALGSGLRFWVGLNLELGPTLFVVNALGTLLLGIVNGREWRPWVHPFLGTGVAGGFTTLSGVAILISGNPVDVWGLAPMFAIGFAAHWLGMKLVRRD